MRCSGSERAPTLYRINPAPPDTGFTWLVEIALHRHSTARVTVPRNLSNLFRNRGYTTCGGLRAGAQTQAVTRCKKSQDCGHILFGCDVFPKYQSRSARCPLICHQHPMVTGSHTEVERRPYWRLSSLPWLEPLHTSEQGYAGRSALRGQGGRSAAS